MPFDLHWDDEHHTILRIDIHGIATWEQHRAVIGEVVEWMQSTPDRVDLIMHDNSAMPSGDFMSHFRESFSKLGSCPNLGLIVNVSQNTFERAIINLALRLYGRRGHHFGGFVDTLDAARQVIAKDRALAENLESR